MERISGDPKQHSQLWRYGSAVLFVVTAILITSLLQRVFAVPFWFSFLGAIMASAWFGGKGPGWLAVVFSAVAVDRLFLPATIGGAVTREGIPFLFAFIVCALLANWFSSWRTRIEHSLRDARDQLDERVMQRTLELHSANDALLAEIQERKRAQEAVAVAQADLAHVNRVLTIGELTASLAHEVSQPLVAVLTSAGACERWLANDPPDVEKARNAVARITTAGSRASEIVSGARALFKKGKPEHRSIQMNVIIQETVHLLHDEAIRRGIHIYTELDPALPQGMGDVTHLQQVMKHHAVPWWLTTEDLPHPENRVTLHDTTPLSVENAQPGLTGAHPSGDTGLTNQSEPVNDSAPRRIRLSYTPNNVESFNRLKDRWVEVLKKAGHATTHIPLHAYFKKRIPLEGVGHQNGTCRMGNDPATSVLDAHCKAHDLDNLYVVDASCFVSASAVNPSLTIIANAIRIADHLLQERLG